MEPETRDVESKQGGGVEQLRVYRGALSHDAPRGPSRWTSGSGAATGAAKAPLIDATRHLVLEAPHPSPLSADRGFFGSRHFSRAKEFLRTHGAAEIVW